MDNKERFLKIETVAQAWQVWALVYQRTSLMTNMTAASLGLAVRLILEMAVVTRTEATEEQCDMLDLPMDMTLEDESIQSAVKIVESALLGLKITLPDRFYKDEEETEDG